MVMFHENHWIKKDKASRQNPSPWINPSLSSQDISHNLLQQNARSVLAHRNERNSQKKENLQKERLSFFHSKTYRRIYFRDCNFLPYLRKLISGHILTHADI
ncbi:hypothetical protein QL285_093505 [Trifolium repens]|nr:hypothetical protein QL285_093505 [Trifolium repens]